MRSRNVPPQLAAPSVESLKYIVENINSPEELDNHPLTHSRVVAEAVQRQPALGKLPPGRRLLGAVAEAFVGMMPSLPPRHGLRLDTQWGEFGILAARYFGPLKYGIPTPTSLRDAWGRIDEAILLFVYGSADGSLSSSARARYRLVGNEPEVAADSTLSDWHRKGLERLARLLSDRERRLQDTSHNDRSWTLRRTVGRMVGATIAALVVVGVVLAGLKAYRLYRVAEQLSGDLRSLQAGLPPSPNAEDIIRVSRQLAQVDHDLTSLQAEAAPVMWAAPLLGWVPTYGGDIAEAGALMEFAHDLIRSAEKTGTAVLPLINPDHSQNTDLSLSDAAGKLSTMRPLLLEADAELQKAQNARSQIDAGQLSPPLRSLIIGKIDPAMDLLDEGLTLGARFPSLLGAGSNGPQTYLLLVQNEDELRPTGGFTTAVGKLVLDQTRVVDLSFENSGDVDNWSMPYPMAPWQLNQYMNSPVLTLRDANWIPDFPTASLYVKQLYAYHQQNSVDGVIAFDQQMLMLLLKTLGPVQVTGVSYPITADNVQQYMRAAKTLPAGQPVPPGWNYKAFIGVLAKAVLGQLLSTKESQWRPLSVTLLQGLDERHLILQLDDQDVSAVLAKHDWNGALSSKGEDFLTVLDTNVGFNKTNAVVETSLVYDVDLSILGAPRSNLLVSHTNRASADVACVQGGHDDPTAAEYSYPIDRCYWDYMRVYVPEGARLLEATPQAIPDSWMILDQHVDPHVDALDEGFQGLSSFGTLLVVPGGGTQNVGMSFDLPSAVVLMQAPDGSWHYVLHVRKQPGTAAVPITIRLHLPPGAIVQSPLPNWIVQGTNLLIKSDLRVDMRLEVIFKVP